VIGFHGFNFRFQTCYVCDGHCDGHSSNGIIVGLKFYELKGNQLLLSF
jgi:hypothetical protein